MGEEGKKISFGFSKLKKPTNLVKPVVVEKKEVEYVDSFDGAKGKFSYKGSVREEPMKKDLVIPLIGTKTALEVIKARLEEKQRPGVKQEPPDSPINGSDVMIKIEKDEENKAFTIEDLAAKEIMAEIQGDHLKEETTNGMVISQGEKPNFEGQRESTLDDYDDVPITEYGLAMLRGMGWKPDKKKDPKDEVELPTPRPKGLGLGADKVMAKPTHDNEDLTIGLNSCVKFVSGSNNGRYGQVQAVDGDTNRVVVKLALGGVISVSEVILVPVSKKDYEKNSKIINSAKYEQYKEISDKALAAQRSKKSDDKNTHRKEKYERSRKSESEDSDNQKKHKRKRHHRSDDSSFSDEEKDRKHKKKNKKDKSRSSSRDRRHKKKKKKKHSLDSESPPRKSRDYDSRKSQSSRR